MRRTRSGTKVWHNPELDTFAKRRLGGGGGDTSSAEERREAKKHRAALEALFAPRKDKEKDKVPADAPAEGASAPGPRPAESGKGARVPAANRIVLAPPPEADPKAGERQRLLARLLLAEGRPGITKAADDFLRAGFQFPDEQDVQLQLLEHSDERRVCAAIDKLATLLAGELPKRRAVLESRLRRIEEYAEDGATRAAATRLRRRVSGRPEAAGTPENG